MLFVIFCVDKPDHGPVRMATRPAHLDYIKEIRSAIRFAGPMTTPDGSAMTGSMLVVEAADLDAARALAAADPYAKAGLFETTLVRAWRQIVPAAD